ncbi:hypothetical protein EDD15DRAFT_2202021 [Pisolithus albus]|nr:hypothetical protein EDD15DRAFT_2202021 [Pisolithus albus]
MAYSTIPGLELDGSNWKAFWTSLLETAATKGWLGILSGQEPSDETLRWEGKDAQVKMLKTSHEMFDLATTFRDSTPISIPIEKPIEALSDDETQELLVKPSKLSVEPPMRERLENGLTEARSEEAQQVPSRSVEVEENLPELHKQLSSRAVEPFESEHIEVPSEKVKKLVEGWKGSTMVCIRDVPDDLPTPPPNKLPSVKLKGEWSKYPSSNVEPTSSSNTNNLPSAQGLPLEGEQALCMSSSPKSSTRNSNSVEDEQPSICKADIPNLTVYDPGGILQWPTVHNEQANKGQVASDGSSRSIEPYQVENKWIPVMGVLLEGEQSRSMSSNETNPRGHMDTSRVLGICTDRLSEPTTTWRQVGMGDIDVTTP